MMENESVFEGKWTFNEQECDLWGHDYYDTKEEAIKAAREYLCDDQQEMYIGKCYTVPLPTDVDVDSLFEQLNERYIENCFEWNDDLFNGVSSEDQEWLEGKMQDLLTEFYKKANIESPCFTIHDIEMTSEIQGVAGKPEIIAD